MAGQPLISESERILRVEPLYRVSSGAMQFDEMEVVPLVTFMNGCVIRNCALSALEHVGRPYYFSYVSGSFSNVCSAIANGLGIGLLPKSAISDDLYILTPENGIPSVPSIQLVLSMTRSDRLYDLFSGYIEKGLSAQV